MGEEGQGGFHPENKLHCVHARLTVQRSLAHVRSLMSTRVRLPFPEFIRGVFDDCGARAAL